MFDSHEDLLTDDIGATKFAVRTWSGSLLTVDCAVAVWSRLRRSSLRGLALATLARLARTVALPGRVRAGGAIVVNEIQSRRAVSWRMDW